MSPTIHSSSLSADELQLLSRAISLNARIAAAITAIVLGTVVWLATAILLWKGGLDVGVNLSVIGTYLPGYKVTWAGAWIGLLWGSVVGAVVGWVMYTSYAATLRTRVERQLASEQGLQSLRVPTFVISGNALGVGLGAIVAGLLFLMTNWLLVRGTADTSVHAALLGNVLPGYTVSFAGSLIGATEVFVATYLWSRIFALTYNKLARRRREIDR